MLNLPKVTCYQAASGSESSEASNCIPFEIFLCIYMYIYIHFRTLCKQTLQLHKLGWYSCTSLMAAPCTEWYIALQVHSTLFSGFLRSETFLPQSVRTQSICLAVASVLPPPFCCAVVQCTVVSCLTSVSSADSHSELSISTNAD